MMNAVIFDLDGVLVHTDDLHFQAWGAIAKNLGITFTAADNDRLRGVSRMESLDILLSLGENHVTEVEKAALATAKNDIYVSLLASLGPDDVDPVVRDTLTQLKNRGVALAIGSSSKNARAILRQVELIDEFDAISDGTDITHSKPDPEVFLHAAAALGLPPAQCLIVEDAHAGVNAAIAGGFAAAGIGDAASHPGVAYSINSLRELLDLIPA